MIGQVLRLSTVFANLMAASTLALALTIAIAGTVERSRSHCHACLHSSAALTKFAPSHQIGLRIADDTRRAVV
ncbi:MAG: hypothetical protein JSS20_06005 [Proteobacteria bacterium]|nr:hypothetical protein [Pseudomonadota bacterium]